MARPWSEARGLKDAGDEHLVAQRFADALPCYEQALTAAHGEAAALCEEAIHAGGSGPEARHARLLQCKPVRTSLFDFMSVLHCCVGRCLFGLQRFRHAIAAFQMSLAYNWRNQESVARWHLTRKQLRGSVRHHRQRVGERRQEEEEEDAARAEEAKDEADEDEAEEEETLTDRVWIGPASRLSEYAELLPSFELMRFDPFDEALAERQRGLPLRPWREQLGNGLSSLTLRYSDHKGRDDAVLVDFLREAHGLRDDDLDRHGGAPAYFFSSAQLAFATATVRVDEEEVTASRPGSLDELHQTVCNVSQRSDEVRSMIAHGVVLPEAPGQIICGGSLMAGGGPQPVVRMLNIPLLVINARDDAEPKLLPLKAFLADRRSRATFLLP